MPNQNELLKNKTHKDDGLSHHERIYYTLTLDVEKNVTIDRTAKLLSLLIEKQIKGGVLLEDELDNMLLELI